MKSSNLLIKKPWISEKATDLAQIGKYVFLIPRGATKAEIKQAVEAIYKVHVVKINVLNKNHSGKKMRKAVVTLASGEKIDIVPH